MPTTLATGPAHTPASTSDRHALSPGFRLGEFEVTRRLGEGGFGIVYLAWDHSLDRRVALKEYMPASIAARTSETQINVRSERYRETFDAGLKSFINEAKLLAQFNHPSLVKVYRFWEANGTAYMVMPFYEGVTLKDRVRALAVPPEEAWLLDLLTPLTEALGVIHAEQCYHRDIAPDNVILLAENGLPLLLDFGAARRVIGDKTQALTVILKPGYAPVEQYAEVPGMRQGAWTDVYALAAVVYWAITGKTPPSSVGRMMRDSYEPLAECAPDHYSLPFLEAIDRALAVLPEQRTQSIDALRQELGMAPLANPAKPVHHDDPELTVIRRPGATSGGQTHAGQRSTRHPTTPKPPTAPNTVTGTPSSPATSGRRPPEASAATATPMGLATARAEPANATSGRSHAVIGLAGLGLAMAASGIWWALQKAPALPSPPHPATATTSVAPLALPPVTPEARPSPAVAPAKAVDATPTAAQAAGPALAPVATVSPDQGPVPAPPPTPTNASAIQPANKPVHLSSPQRAEVAKAERRPPEPGNSAECANVMQRLSLGESSPELMDRIKSLKCR